MPDRHSNGRMPAADAAAVATDREPAPPQRCAPANRLDDRLDAGAPDAGVGERVPGVGKRARARFEATLPASAPRAAAGSIAVSFAVVAFRNWPRRGL